MITELENQIKKHLETMTKEQIIEHIFQFLRGVDDYENFLDQLDYETGDIKET